MNKTEAKKIIFEAVDFYNHNLLNNNFLFLYDNYNNPKVIECLFLKKHFKHLTGVSTALNANRFYDLCINKKLSKKSFDLKKGTTNLKLSVINKALDIENNVKMIGVYDKSKFYLNTDKLIGGKLSCLGVIQDKKDNCLIPNTLLNENLRKISNRTFPVIAIFKKNKNNYYYENLCYLNKKIESINNVNLNNLDNTILNKLKLVKQI